VRAAHSVGGRWGELRLCISFLVFSSQCFSLIVSSKSSRGYKAVLVRMATTKLCAQA